MLVLRSLSMLVLLSGLCSAQRTERVSLGANAAQANAQADTGGFGRTISTDGRFVVFWSSATNVVVNDVNGLPDVFVRDRLLGVTEMLSVASSGQQGDGFSFGPLALSSDGRYVAFGSTSTNLVVGDMNGWMDVFVRDRLSGTTERVSISSLGSEGDSGSYSPTLSSDARYVAFYSHATDLVFGDLNTCDDCFVRDRLLGVTERISVATSGLEGNDSSQYPAVSGDGRFVAFMSLASNLVQGDSNGTWDVFVRDRAINTTIRVSVDSAGVQASGASTIAGMSSDGRYIIFSSLASNLVPGDTNASADAFVYDRNTGITERISVSSSGAQGNAPSIPLSLSDDGRFISFRSTATNLVPGDTNSASDVFLRDRVLGTTERLSIATDGSQSNGVSGGAGMTPDGRYVLFSSDATNLVPNDTNNVRDVFIRDRFAAGFTSLCDPGTNGVLACPCNNTPSNTGRGCDNSSSTGGAALTAIGIAYLSLDSLVFHTSGERPNATSVLLQGDSLLANGAVFGQGIRCAGGALKRMYVKAALGGGIVAPDLSAGDATISMRSALLGAPIQAGQPRFYLVYYRDPLVLGGCPASSTFNCTQTGSVVYWP